MIEQLSKKCFDAIVGIAKQQDAPNKKHMGLLQRSIIVLGAICEQTISIHDTIMKKSCKDKEIEHSDVLSHIGSQDAAQSQPIDAAAHVLLEERVAKVNILSVNTITKSCFEAICGSTYTAIRFLLSSIIPPDESVHKRAAQALCSVFVGCSRLMILAQSEVSLKHAFYSFRCRLIQKQIEYFATLVV